MWLRGVRGDCFSLLSSSLDVSFSQPKYLLGKNEFVAYTERIFISLKTQNFCFRSFVYSFTEDKETGTSGEKIYPLLP